MQKLVLTVIAAAGLMVFACSSFTTRQDYDPQMDFSRLKTYDWISAQKETNMSELVARRIRTAVERELDRKGFRQTGTSPDFWASLHAGVKEQIRVRDSGYRYGDHYNSRFRGPREIDVHEYEEGCLILDFVDPASRELFWRGEVRGVLHSNPTPEDRERRIAEAVSELLKDFPPEPIR